MEWSHDGCMLLMQQVGVQRGESADSEHTNSDSAPDPMEEDGRQQTQTRQQQQPGGSCEGAGESGGSGSERAGGHQNRTPRTETLPAMPSKLSRAGAADAQQQQGSNLDPAVVAEMARRRRERFGTAAEQRSGGAKTGPAALRKAPLASKASAGAEPGARQQQAVLRLSGLEALARSRSSLAELVESDLFLPETPRRDKGGNAAASKTCTPAATPTLGNTARGAAGGAVKAEAAEGAAPGFQQVHSKLSQLIACLGLHAQ